MSTSPMKQKLQTAKKQWDAVYTHAADQPQTDPQSDYQRRLALEKLAAIARNEQRLENGSLERCDRCSAPIDPERLDMILDSDCHICAACAGAARLARHSRPSSQSKRRPFVHHAAARTISAAVTR